MKKIGIIILMFFGLYSLSAQDKVVQDVGSFTIVKVFDRISAELIPSSSNKVEVSGLKRENVEVVTNNGELKVRMKTVKLLAGDDVNVKIYYTGDLTSVQGSEGAVVKGTGRINTDSIFLNAKEGAVVNVEVDAKKIEARVNSGGEINVSGEAGEQDIVITSGGKYNAKGVDSENAAVAINAGGNAVITASGKVSAKTRAGGVIDIYGDAQVSQQTLAGGKVNIH